MMRLKKTNFVLAVGLCRRAINDFGLPVFYGRRLTITTVTSWVD